MATETNVYRIWMRPLWPNEAEPRWYPPHVPTKDEGSQEWAEAEAKRLSDSDPWSAWRYEAKPANWDTKCGCGALYGHRENRAGRCT